VYLDKLASDGIIVFHISNRYVDLEPVIARLQDEEGLAGLIQHDYQDQEEPEKYATSVIILARSTEAFGGLANDPRWKKLNTPEGTPLWTDDYSDLLRYLRWRDKE
jgi:hypothetical protein